MKNKGFTLVELLGVIVILAVIIILTFPAISKVLSSSKETITQKQIYTILGAAYDFSLKNINLLPDTNKVNFITLGELKNEGLIPFDIKNPSTKEMLPDNLVISIKNVGAGYKYSNNNSKLEGEYLYTVELDKLESDKNLLPDITIEGEGLTKNSNGSYIMLLELGDTYTTPEYTSESSKGVDITSNVKINKTKNNQIIDKIDTNISSIYKVYYSVVDNEGNANVTILNIIIADTEKPSIKIPEETIINKGDTSFNLMQGVTCEDNSGFCDISLLSSFDYNITGKQIIEYQAKDPSGNTEIKKRVITIE